MKNILPKALITTMAVSAVLLTALLYVTTPTSAGAVGILAIFILAYAFTVSVVTLFIYGISRLFVLASHLFTTRKPVQVLTLRRSYYYASVVALAPIIIVSMNSVGSFGIYELALVLVLIMIGCVYVTKRTA